MNRTLIGKVIQRHGLQDAINTLSEKLETSELTSVLTEVYALRQRRLEIPDLSHALQHDRFCKPSDVDPRTFHAFDALAYARLPAGFQPVELSPLAPLGTVGLLANVDPGNVIQSSRGQEVVSDCTNVLAIYAALLRKKDRKKPVVQLSAAQRLVRAQKPMSANHTGHFRILTLVSCGRDEGSYKFEKKEVVTHINYYLAVIRSFASAKTNDIQIILKEYAETGIDWNEVIKECEQFNVQFEYRRIDRPDWHYYAPFQFNINIQTEHGMLNLADGGMVDWTQKLLSDRKERCLISGFGTELFCKMFGLTPDPQGEMSK